MSPSPLLTTTPSDLSDDISIQQLKQYWYSRSLLLCNGIKKVINSAVEEDKTTCRLLEINPSKFEDKPPSTLHRLIKAQATKIAKRPIHRQGTLFDNLQLIKQKIELNTAEIEILLFACSIYLDRDYCEAYLYFGRFNDRQFYSFLANTLDIPYADISNALNRNNLLHQSGLLSINTTPSDLEDKFLPLSDFFDGLERPQKNIESFFSATIVPAPKPVLTPKHYRHIKQDYARLSAYIKTVCDKKTKGANVLIYGSPGTGKTQWVRTLTHELKLKLSEISLEWEGGGILSGDARVKACQLAQTLFKKKKRYCLLFDEIEDLFQSSFFDQFSGNKSSPHKGWINQLLENNPVPTFWITNDIEVMDEAILRRFDLVFELPAPPYTVRKQMLTETLKDTTVSRQWIDKMSHLDHLPPAIINRAAKVNNLIGGQKTDDAEKNLEQMIGNTLKSMGHQHKAKRAHTTEFYDPALINTKAPLDKIAKGLKKSGMGRLCLYGPPGTGKSAYAKYLAEHLKMPLIAKQASDIIDCYVGETEKNIANMFEQARQEKALLLLDEADSFLRNRLNNQHSWETTQVNELLVQMENFEGIFICSTNLMNNLDTAALRRFDFKLEFAYLNPKQAWKLLKGFINQPISSLSKDEKEEVKKQIAAIQQLTPGDFAAVKRRLTVLGEMDDLSLFVQSLRDEVGFKGEGSKRSIGFGAEF
ncbi:MAG: AAA family ATPase [Methylococcaceae bacterium]